MRSRRTHSPRRFRPLGLFIAALGVLFLAACRPDRGGGGGNGANLSGTYEATRADGTWTIEFKRGGKATMTMQEPGGQPDVVEADFLIDGNRVTVQAPGGMPIVLVRNGDVLEGSVMGGIMRFTKK